LLTLQTNLVIHFCKIHDGSHLVVFSSFWLPDYSEDRGLDIKKSWVHLVTIYAIITVLSIIGGWVTGLSYEGGMDVTRARKTGMFIFACCVVPIFFRDQSGRLARGPAYQSRGCGASGVVGKSFPRQCPTCFRSMQWPRWWGWVDWPERPVECFPHLLRTDAGQVHRCGKCDRGLRDIVFNFARLPIWFTFALHHFLAPKFEPFPLKPHK